MVEVDNLTKYYGATAAIDSVTFQAREGEILAFLGKNGAGKTTTMRVMTGFMPPSSGTVRINGFDIREDSLAARRQIGYLPETAPLYEDMTVRGYLSFCARLREVPAADLAARVESVMASVNISERRNWIIGKLSKGLRRRVGLAQALVHNPKVLILDEPTEGLDPEQIIDIRRLIAGLRGDHTVILSTHILPEAQALADRVVIIERGRIVATDTTANLTALVQRAQRLRVEVRGPSKEVRKKLAAVAGVRAVEELEGAEAGRCRFIVESARDTDLRDKLASTVVTAGWGLLELERLDLTLEDIFLQLTGQKDGLPLEPLPEAAAEIAADDIAAEAQTSDQSDMSDTSDTSDAAEPVGVAEAPPDEEPAPAEADDAAKDPTGDAEGDGHAILIEAWRTSVTGPDKSWVVFEHGTCVVLTEPQGDLAAQATALLCDWVPQIGSSKADFSVAELENGHGWVITCAHPDILNFIARNDAGPETGDAVIGMVGRSKRQQDAQEPRVIHVEDRRQPGVAVGVETAGAEDAPAPVSATSVGEGDLKDE